MTMSMAVSLVIPGRNASGTIRQCLEAVVPLVGRDALQEIIFVDDGSTDASAEIVKPFPVRYLRGAGKGPGSARNIGWRAAQHPIVWFIDSDCVAEPDALDRLLPHLDDPKVAGVGGSYGNMEEDSLLACLIHEEIVERHLAMPSRVNFLATFNVAYRRSVLEQVRGFDERFLKGQDAELSWRVLEAGYELAFEVNSRVKHYHPVSWRSYLRTQRQQGYWRVWMYMAHRGHAAGDSYSSFVDHLQPPLAMLVLACVPLSAFPLTFWVTPVLLALLLGAQIPMTWKLLRRLRKVRYLGFAFMSFARAFWRGVGLTMGTLATLRICISRINVERSN
ncbi:MAG: glycosyltransferase [Planctomycetota bacterium]